jgi:hypothetical protein
MKNMTDEDYAQFLPFSAVNNFMLSDFRQRVLQDVLGKRSSQSNEVHNQINRLIRGQVKVPGFRNPTKAPPPLLAKKSTRLFEESPEFAALVLASWAANHPDLAENMYSLLKNLNWDVLPIETDRTQLPGFFPEWPSDSDFEAINQNYRESYPDSAEDADSISLMAVWISLKLPYEIHDENQAQS